MGFAIADQLAAMGADVTLVAGPTAQKSHQPGVKRVDVTSAAEMLDTCLQYYKDSKACIVCADFKAPVTVSAQKIKNRMLI